MDKKDDVGLETFSLKPDMEGFAKSKYPGIMDETYDLLPMIKEHYLGMDIGLPEQILAQQLQASGLTVAVAESCTGGYLAHLFTSIPGSSNYFLGGVVSG